MAKSSLSFVCQNCGAAYNRWQGKCEACGEWNTLSEEEGATSVPVSIRSKRKGRQFALESLSGKSQDDSDEAPAIQSNDILARDAVTKVASVKHVLVSWKDLAREFGGNIDKRAAARTRADADKLAVEILGKARAGEDFDELMRTYSEDGGSNQTARAYDVTPDAKLVFEFKRLSLRLNVGEAGLVKSQFGWHVIKLFE